MIEVGHIVKTNYGTGPYRVLEVINDCRCADYLQSLDCPHMYECPSDCDECPLVREPHIELICGPVDEPKPRPSRRSYLGRLVHLNDYVLRRLNSEDEVYIVGEVANRQLMLF